MASVVGSTGNTLNPGDNLDLGTGTNTFDIVFSNTSSTTVTGFIVKNVQDFNISNFGTGTTSTATESTLAFVAPQDGIRNINLAGSFTQSSPSSSTVSAGTTVTGITSLVGASMNNGQGSLTLAYNSSVVAGSADSQNLALNNQTGGSFTAGGIETLNINAAGLPSSGVVLPDSTNTFATVNISGGAALGIDIKDTAVKTVNGSTATGALTLGVSDLAAASSTTSAEPVNVAGGTANDEFLVGTSLDNDVFINGNGGVNTLTLSGGLTAAKATGVTNVQVIKAVDKGVDSSYDLNAVASATTFVAANTIDTNSSTVTATNFADTDNLVVANGAVDGGTQSNVTVQSASDTTSNVLNAAIAGVTFGDLTANDAETVNLASNANPLSSTATNLIDGIASFTDATSVVVTGGTNLKIDDLRLSQPSNGLSVSYNSSAFTGKSNIFITTTGNQNITTGVNDDVVRVANNDLNGFDNINLGGGTNTLTAVINADIGLLNVTNAQNVNFTIDASASAFLGNNAALRNLAVSTTGSRTGTFTGLANNSTAIALTSGANSTGKQTFQYSPGSSVGNLVVRGDSTSGRTFDEIQVNNVSTLNLSSASATVGSTAAGLKKLTSDAQLTTLNINSTAAVTLGESANTANLATINASQSSGAVTVGAGVARTTTASITGGSGSDNIGLNINTQSLNTINAGTGTDTLTLAGTSNAAVTVVDLSSTTDQLVSINGQINSAVQVGFENLDASALTSGFGVNVTAATNTTSIKATQNADVITGASSGTVTYVAGASNDVATLGAATESYNFASTLVSGTLGSIAAVAASVGTDTITNFNADSADKFVVSETVFGTTLEDGSTGNLKAASFLTVATTATTFNTAASGTAGTSLNLTGFVYVAASSSATSGALYYVNDNAATTGATIAQLVIDSEATLIGNLSAASAASTFGSADFSIVA